MHIVLIRFHMFFDDILLGRCSGISSGITFACISNKYLWHLAWLQIHYMTEKIHFPPFPSLSSSAQRRVQVTFWQAGHKGMYDILTICTKFPRAMLTITCTLKQMLLIEHHAHYVHSVHSWCKLQDLSVLSSVQLTFWQTGLQGIFYILQFMNWALETRSQVQSMHLQGLFIFLSYDPVWEFPRAMYVQ